ncbi:MAG: phosphoribosylformylglycinamidine synthase subunit PurL [Elusimicrobiota bacterium]|nr:phosphoribosylformylglycinamidine synthase subunit PurL [Endomicrobiia bacterium]MDW8166410.1 phosphoribosylformylglycinamidine synthase subunit PurL [Elusimicrobiota bacterium]
MKLYNTINILKAKNRELLEISKKGLLSLSLEEMRAIKKYFQKEKRNPTDCELETIAQTWSEHCKHKTLTASVELRTIYNNKIKVKKYNNVLKETIFYATKKIKHPDCLSVFEDNAGVVRFDSGYALAFKVETHNHPSALEPYGGAATGIGGVIRDIIGCGLSAKPIANTDVFCFGELNYKDKLPKGVFHPKRIMKGVVSGVRDYGNRMGIPTLNGAILFDNGYLYNPLVYCGCVGIIPEDKIRKVVKPSQLIVLVGGKTGRDGIHGATFSSDALHKDLPTSVVQIGDPITEKMFLDVILKARDLGLFTAITDCGAGGLSSACGELTKDCGCRIYLERVPLKYKEILPWEIWLSESQERMVVIVEKDKAEEFLKLCNSEDVETTVIGEVTNTKRLEVYYNSTLICNLDMEFLHNGLPKRRYVLTYKPKTLPKKEKKIKINISLEEILKKVLSCLNVSSKEWVIRQYDHEVQGNTILKPLCGDQHTNFYSPQDACVIYPFNIENLKNTKKAIAISCGIKPAISSLSIERMVEYVIDEAIRNVICVGANLEKIFLLDNFCWGELNKKNLTDLFLACETAKNVSIKFSTPFISGKDSLNNYYIIGKRKISIPSTLLISAIGIVDNYQDIKTSYFKNSGNHIFLLGKIEDSLGGSIISKSLNFKAHTVTKLNIERAKNIYKFINKHLNLIISTHDISDGGLITTLVEMCFAKQLGAKIFILCRDLISYLFSEPPSCIVVEVEDKNYFETLLAKNKVPYQYLGEVTSNPYLEIFDGSKKLVSKISISDMYEIWSKSLSKML